MSHTAWRLATRALATTLVLFVPVTISALHRLWRAARSIQLNTRDAVPATKGIADNIASIALLDQTIETTATVAAIVSAIERHVRAAADVSAGRSPR